MDYETLKTVYENSLYLQAAVTSGCAIATGMILGLGINKSLDYYEKNLASGEIAEKRKDLSTKIL